MQKEQEVAKKQRINFGFFFSLFGDLKTRNYFISHPSETSAPKTLLK
jgi:hypothetical protein